MIEKTSGTKNPITLRRVLPIASALLLFALVLVMPAAAADVTVSSQNDLDSAITNVDGTKTITIDTAGTYSLSKIKGADGATTKELIFKGVAGVIIDIPSAVSPNDFSLTFEDVTVQFPDNGQYIGFHHVKEVHYKNCKIDGTVFLYGETEEFTNCIFENKANAYCVWTYGAKMVSFADCTFNTGGKAVLVYTEGKTEATIKLDRCTFNDDDSQNVKKAAVEIGSSPQSSETKYNIIANDCVVNGFAVTDEGTSTGFTLYGNKDSMDFDHIGVEIDGVKVTETTYIYTLGTPTFDVNNNKVLFPINFENKDATKVPTSWDITVTVKDADGKIVSSDLYYTVTKDTTTGCVGTINPTREANKFLAYYGAVAVPADVSGLFTVGIEGLPATTKDYTVSVGIMTYAGSQGQSTYYNYYQATTSISPEGILGKSDNIYKDGVGVTAPWDMTNKVEATYEVANMKTDTYTTEIKDELVARGAYSLSLTESGTVTITKVTANGEKPVDETTEITADATGKIVMTIAQADQNDADYFIIKFVGNKVGDVESVAGENGVISVLDVDYILHQSVMPAGDCYLSDGNYLVYADVNHDGTIDEEDARLTFKTALGYELKYAEKKAVWMYTPTAP